MQAIHSTLIKELHHYAKSKQYQRAVVAVSGGLDSAVTLCLAVRAFGGKNVCALFLPEVGLTPSEDIEHARALADYFGCTSHYQPINNFLVDYNFSTWEKTEEANEMLKTRVRNTLLKHYAEAHNALVLGTANRSDILISAGTLDGELTGELHVLGDLYKTEVQELAAFIGLPQEILEKAPSRHLKPHQSDEETLGASWAQVDEILKQLSAGSDPEPLIQHGMDALLVHKIARLVQQNGGRSEKLTVLKIGHISESIQKAIEAEASTL